MEYTKGEWEQSGTLILSYGEEGSMICQMIEPYPKSGLVQAEELEMHSASWGLQMNNAHLIVSAVNSCIKINPDNPQAVAESIPDIYEVLKVALAASHNPSVENILLQALAKAEGKL